MLCRSSDMQEFELEGLYAQRIKYHVFTLYRERIGRIQGEELLVTYNQSDTRI